MAHQTAAPLPTGTVTFLLGEVERSAALWETAPDEAQRAVDRYDELVDAAVAAHGGVRPEEQGEGDRAIAAFGSAAHAVAAALDLQRAVATERWPEGGQVGLRIGLHTGEASVRDGRRYVGAALHRAARVRDAAQGGQVLLSSVTASVTAGALPPGARLVDRGEHRLRDLSRPERLFELAHDDLPGDLPPPRSLGAAPNNLPTQLTSFFGREAELAEVEQLLGERRLVTLTGAGGCGKTRLAAQAAAALLDREPDEWRGGVWWVDLGSLTDPDRVASLTASTLDLLVEPVGGPLRALQTQLRHRRLLVCLDTCEHVLDAAAAVAEALLRAGSGVTVLATSREPLRVTGETVWRVPSLTEDESVQLFADRAALVHPGVALDPDDEVVRGLCRRLDGIPLAIELAAAWVRVLTPTQIAEGLDDSFRLLVGGPRDVIARQQTLAASMDWSHHLLDELDQVVFRRLAVFAGSFTLDAARRVCAGRPVGDADVITALSRLVDKSLVAVHESDGGPGLGEAGALPPTGVAATDGAPSAAGPAGSAGATGSGEVEARFRLLDTIRQYAEGRLEAAGETAATRSRHLDHYLERAERAEPELERDQDVWRHRLETDHDNFEAALRWGLDAAASPDPERGRRLAASLARLWFLHGHTREGNAFLRQALARAPDDRTVLQARLHCGLAMLGLADGRPSVAAEAAQRGLEIAVAVDDPFTRGRCSFFAAYGPFYHDAPAAFELVRQAQADGRAVGDPLSVDYGQLLEVCVLTWLDRHEESVAMADDLLARVMPRGERFCAAFARLSHAYDSVLRGDVRRADEMATDALRWAEPLGDYFTVGHNTSNLAWVKSYSGETEIGRKLLEPLVGSIEGAGLVDVSWMALALGRLHLVDGHLEDAVTWLGRAVGFEVPITGSGEPTTANWVVARVLPGLSSALRRLGRRDEAAEQAARGVEMARRLDTIHVLADALDETAFLAAADDPERAEDLHHEALGARLERGLRTGYADSLDALAWRAAAAESFAEAVRLAAASDAARDVMGYPRPPLTQPEHAAALGAAQAGLGEDGFADAWAEGSGLSLDEAVAYARRARGARRRPTTGWASLTPTELDVVRLVVEGLTNPQIGARLFVSRGTVKTHLSNIYAKLGLANRTELASLARARDLRPPSASGS